MSANVDNELLSSLAALVYARSSSTVSDDMAAAFVVDSVQGLLRHNQPAATAYQVGTGVWTDVHEAQLDYYEATGKSSQDFIIKSAAEGVQQLPSGDTLMMDDLREVLFLVEGGKLTVEYNGSLTFQSDVKSEIREEGGFTVISLAGGDRLVVGKHGLQEITRGGVSYMLVDQSRLTVKTSFIEQPTVSELPKRQMETRMERRETSMKQPARPERRVQVVDGFLEIPCAWASLAAS